VTIGTASRRGHDLPYSLVAGVTPCGRSWLVAPAKLQGTIFAPEGPQLISPFSEVLDQRPTFSVIALNAPVGYLDIAAAGGRTCDREARALLGPKRGSSIQSAPVRSSTNELEFLPDHLDAISMTLLPRYREVAADMAPFRQRSVYEVHSDMTFYELNDSQPLLYPKHTEKGIEERRALLQVKFPAVDRILSAESELPGASIAHLLDVAAFVWTARRIFNKAAVRIPQDPEWDEQGLRMEIVR
jgi:predicted RNase H-like nuclease